MARGLKVKPGDFPKLSEMWRWYVRTHGRLDGIVDVHKREPPRQKRELIYYVSESTEDIPAYGCMAVTGKQVSGDKVYYTVAKPSTTFRRQYLANGSVEIGYQEFGAIPERRHYKWLYNSGTPAIDEGFGPTPGEWYLTKNYPAVTEVVGIYDEDDTVFWGTVHTIDDVIGKLARSLAAGSTTEVDIWGGVPEAAISGYQVTSVRDWLMKSTSPAISAGKKVVVRWINGVPYAVAAECS